jgi:radical SAM protein with 4Fe4S-binding SPASM domain
LSFETICRIVDEAADAGVFSLTLTGGEPLLRPDFLDIYDHIKSKGILPALFTNGTLITPRTAEHLAEYPPFYVDVSIYGRTRETYEAVTGQPGSYEKCLQGIQLLVDSGIKVFLKTPVMIQNRDEVGDLKGFAESLGTRFRYDLNLNPRLEHMDDRFGPYDFGLPLQERADLEFSDVEKVRAWAAYSERVESLPRQRTLYACGAGLYGFFIDARGHMTMCVLSRYPSYDLTTGSFEEGWELLARTRQEVSEDPAVIECQNCEVRAFCQHCPARAQLEYGPGAVSERVEWVCRLAHLRAEKLRMIEGAKR